MPVCPRWRDAERDNLPMRRQVADGFADIPRLAEGARRIIKATHYSRQNFDARLQPDGEFKFLECNPRFTARLTALRFAGVDLMRMGLPNAPPDVFHAAASGAIYGRSDLSWLRRNDLRMARVMLKSWLEYCADPIPDYS